MTLDKFKKIIGYDNPKVLYFIIGVVFMSAIEALAREEYTNAALYGIIIVVNIIADRTTYGQKAQ